MIICDDKHRYFVDGRRVPGVSEIMKDCGLTNYPDTPEVAAAAERGTNVHLACQYYDDNTLDEDTVLDEYIPYLNQWKKFRTENPGVIVASEIKLYSKIWNFAGTIDRVIGLAGKFYLRDIKTGSETPAIAVQLAAYEILWNETHPTQKLYKKEAIYLKPDKYTIRGYDCKKESNIFKCGAQVHNFKLEKGII